MEFRKLCVTLYPSNMAPMAAKLWQSAFGTIPYVSFFDAEILFLKIIWLETCMFLHFC